MGTHAHTQTNRKPPKLTLGRGEIPEEEPQHEEKREVASQPAALLHIQPPPHQQQFPEAARLCFHWRPLFSSFSSSVENKYCYVSPAARKFSMFPAQTTEG
ncbi:hypothetical protein JOQ06_009713 [Pogonophryne albipinna]|uniref:Uncharacterized protein n=1 Tax=Pogonophryne albipinna TaxID=1090488 RepID=A0AAD6BRE8_9TELE|nr:hypothetical protein JOQ06_009713 [Pogonophryne albipinna]